MLSKFIIDVRFHIFEFLTGRELILLDISMNINDNVEIYRYLKNVEIDDLCIDYFKKNRLNISILNISNTDSLSKINNMEIGTLNIVLNFDKYVDNQQLINKIIIDFLFKVLKIESLFITLNSSDKYMYSSVNLAIFTSRLLHVSRVSTCDTCNTFCSQSFKLTFIGYSINLNRDINILNMILTIENNNILISYI